MHGREDGGGLRAHVELVAEVGSDGIERVLMSQSDGCQELRQVSCGLVASSLGIASALGRSLGLTLVAVGALGGVWTLVRVHWG